MTVKDRNTTTTPDARLSMRAAREARNGLAVTLANLDASELGLTEHEAAKRLARDGVNQVAHDLQPHALVQLLKALNNPFIYVLLTLAGISFVTDYWLPVSAGEADDADLTKVIIIMTMVSLSSLLRFWQEYRSNKAADALKAMVRSTATVLRREQIGQAPRLREVPMDELVAGDIVQLSAGDMIPADIRLLEARDLFIARPCSPARRCRSKSTTPWVMSRRSPPPSMAYIRTTCSSCRTSASWGPMWSVAAPAPWWSPPADAPILARWPRPLPVRAARPLLTAA